jgi:hypothetical protein
MSEMPVPQNPSTDRASTSEATTLAPPSAERMGEARKAGAYLHSSRDLTWRKHPDGWALHCVGRRRAIVHVVPDGTYPAMWRIRHPDGRLSDMVNLSRAKDAGRQVALGILNR